MEQRILNRERVIELLREQQTYLASEYGIRKIGLFGSFAKERPEERSDVDLVVEFERPIGLRFVELAEYLENLFDRKVDILTPDGVQDIRRKTIAKSIMESIVYV